MKYIKFKIPENTTETEKENVIVNFFFVALGFILKLIIPKGNPDFDKQIDNVEYWLLECEIESGIPEREIGIDKNGNVIVKMPFKDNYGYWTDNSLKFNDFIEEFKATEIEKREFEINWKNLKETKKNMVGKKTKINLIMCILNKMGRLEN
jgi:hypothetical protein